MRLLLDQHYSPDIAEALRARGHDVVSVKERAELSGLTDRELLTRMAAERRTVVTENVADFMPLVREAAARGDVHYGLVFSPSRSMPRSKGTIGLFVQALDALLSKHPKEDGDALANQTHWLQPG